MKNNQHAPHKNYRSRDHNKSTRQTLEGKVVLVTVKRLGINGEGIGYYKRKIIFIPGALPHEDVLVRVVLEKQKYLEGELVRVKKKSKDQVKPVDHYDVGGIELEHLAYPAQLKFKRDVIKQSLKKYRPKDYPDYQIKKTLGMDEPYHYRNKLQFQIRAGKNGQVQAGLYRPNSHELVDLPTFSTQTDLSMKTIRLICQLLAKWKILPYNEHQETGIIKTVVVRESFANHQLQVVFISRTKKIPQINNLITDLVSQQPAVVSVMQNVNPRQTSLIWGEQTLRLYGQDHLIEKIAGNEYHLSARAFFQLNTPQTEVLYGQVKQALDLQAGESLVDAYCGAGTIGIYLAKEASAVYGMDVTPEAITDAQKNAELAGLDNAHYEVGTAEDLLAKWTKAGIEMDALVVDPPRVGLDDKLIKTILKYQPNKFVYVSCNPSTLAADLVQLTQAYDVDYIQPVDMFPQTARTEAVVKLTLKDY